MGLAIGAQKACLQVQQSLDDIAGANVPNLKITNPGALQAVTRSENISGFQGLQVQDPGGKNRTVRIQYWTNPRTESGTDCYPDICTPGTTDAQKYADMTLSLCRNQKMTLDEEQFRDFCTDGIRNSEFARNLMQAKMNEFLNDLDQDVVTFLSTHTGNFYNKIAGPKTVTMFKTDGSIYEGGELTIANDMEDAGVMGMPAAVGLGYLREYSQKKKFACCDSRGMDLSGNSPWTYFSDRKVDTTVGTNNNFFVLAPGAVQLVSKVKWVGPYEDIRSDKEAKTTVNVTIPGTGYTLPVDFTVYKSFCGADNDGKTEWVFTWSLNFDFFSLPSDVEDAASPYRSVNGIFHYVGDCGEITCADVNS